LKTVIVAAGVLIDGERVLLSQRRADTHLAGMWEFPGGKVESGEDPREALRRELEEELGVDAIVGDIVDVAFHRYDDANKAVLLLFYEATLTTESKAQSTLPQ
jgi:8-oxo-dGTP diphosphatase